MRVIGEEGFFRAGSFTADGQCFVSGGDNLKLTTMRVATGEILSQVCFPAGAPQRCCAVHPTEPELVACGDDGVLRNYLGESMIERWTVSFGIAMWMAGYSRCGTWVVAGDDKGNMKVLRADSGECVHSFQHFSNRSWCVTFGDSTFAVTGGKVVLHELQSWKVLHTFKVGAFCAAFSPSSELLSIGGAHDPSVFLYSLSSTSTWELDATFPHLKRIWCVQFSPDGSQLAASDNTGTTTVRDVASGATTHVFTDKSGPACLLAWHPDGHILATGGVPSITLRDLQPDPVRFTYNRATNEKIGEHGWLAVSSQGFVAFGGKCEQTGWLVIASVSGERLATIPTAGYVRRVRFSKDGSKIAVWVDTVSQVLVFRVPSGELLTTHQLPGLAVAAVEIRADGLAIVAAGNWGGTVYGSDEPCTLLEENMNFAVWHTTQKDTVFTCDKRRLCIHQLDSNLVKVVNIVSEMCDCEVEALAVSPNGEMLACGLDEEDTVEVRSCESLRVLFRVRDCLGCNVVHFSPAGCTLVTASCLVDVATRSKSSCNETLSATMGPFYGIVDVNGTQYLLAQHADDFVLVDLYAFEHAYGDGILLLTWLEALSKSPDKIADVAKKYPHVVNIRGINNDTIAHVCARVQELEALRAFFEFGRYTPAVNSAGETAVDIAGSLKDHVTVTLLLSALDPQVQPSMTAPLMDSLTWLAGPTGLPMHIGTYLQTLSSSLHPASVGAPISMRLDGPLIAGAASINNMKVFSKAMDPSGRSGRAQPQVCRLRHLLVLMTRDKSRKTLFYHLTHSVKRDAALQAFDLELFRHVVMFKWHAYAKYIHYLNLLLQCGYLTAFTLFARAMTWNQELAQGQDQWVLLFLNIVFASLILLREFMQILGAGVQAYLISSSNWLDVLSMAGFLTVVGLLPGRISQSCDVNMCKFEPVQVECKPSGWNLEVQALVSEHNGDAHSDMLYGTTMACQASSFQAVLVITTILMYFRAALLLSVEPYFAPFLQMVAQIMIDLLPFAILLTVVLLAFTVAFAISGVGTFPQMLFVSYMTLNGRGEDPFTTESTTLSDLGLVLLCFFFFIVNIVLLNLMIALMSDSFNTVRQHIDVEVLLMRAKGISDLEMLIPRSYLKRFSPEYMYTLQRKMETLAEKSTALDFQKLEAKLDKHVANMNDMMTKMQAHIENQD